MGLARAVDVAFAPVYCIEGFHERARSLALGLAQRPQPGQVEVPVTDGAVGEVALRCRRKLVCERLPCCGDIARAEAGIGQPERGAQLVFERGVLRGTGQHQQRQVVVIEGIGFVILGRKICTVEGGTPDLIEDEAVIGHVGIKLEGSRRSGDVLHGPEPAGTVRQVTLLKHCAHRIEDLAAGGVDQPFAADTEKHDRIAQTHRNIAGDAQPSTVEGSAPAGAGAHG